MKKTKVSGTLYSVALGLPLMLAIIFLVLAVIAYARPGGAMPEKLGTLQADVSWKVHLKENPFYPSQELGSDYAYIQELLKDIRFDLDFAFSGGEKDASVNIEYQVDGVLKVNQNSAGNKPLLVQEYPKLAKGSGILSGPASDDIQSFDLLLSPYINVVESFRNAYNLDVSSRLDLSISIKATLGEEPDAVVKNIPLSLTIPLNDAVFQISGSPSGKEEFERQLLPGGQGGGQATVYLVIAVVLLLLAGAAFLFLEPQKADPQTALLKQTLQKCKGNMIVLQTDPREQGMPSISVGDISGLILLSEQAGQPVLYLHREECHSFFALVEGTLYSYEIKYAIGIAKEPATQGDGMITD